MVILHGAEIIVWQDWQGQIPPDWEDDYIRAEEATDADLYFCADRWSDADSLENGYPYD